MKTIIICYLLFAFPTFANQKADDCWKEHKQKFAHIPKIDTRPLKIKLSQARSNYNLVKANFDRASKDIIGAEEISEAEAKLNQSWADLKKAIAKLKQANKEYEQAWEQESKRGEHYKYCKSLTGQRH